MIKERIIASRYAEGFIKYARESIGTAKALADLIRVRQIMRDNPEFKKFLENPEIAFTAKCKIIDKVVDGDLSDEIRHLLKLLLETKRIENFLDIVEYARMKYSHRSKEDVLLKISYPLSLELIKKIENKLEDKFKQKFKFYIELDSSLLGGIQVVRGNKVIDGSVRRRLDDLKEKLKAVKVD